MITLELDELYGMDSFEDLMDAIKMLKEHGWSDSGIQEILDRSKSKMKIGPMIYGSTVNMLGSEEEDEK